MARYDECRGHDIYLYETLLKSQLKYGVSVRMGTAVHWAICVDGQVYDLAKDDTNTFAVVPRPKYQWFWERSVKESDADGTRIGTTAKPWSPDIIEYMAKQVWEGPMHSKYEADEQNCQLFIMLLVDLIRDPENPPEFPDTFKKTMRNTKRGAIWGWGLTFAGASLFAAVDGGATLMQLSYAVLWSSNSTRLLVNHEGKKDDALYGVHLELKERLRNEGILCA